MALLLIETTTPDEIVEAVQAGTLFGVDLGSTTSAASYSDYCLIELTSSRAVKVCNAAPEDLSIPIMANDPPSFTDAADDAKIWFLRGRLT